jgi:hypothetical protein
MVPTFVKWADCKPQKASAGVVVILFDDVDSGRTACTKLLDTVPVAVSSHRSVVSNVSFQSLLFCLFLSFSPLLFVYLFICTSLFSVLVRISCFVSVFFILLCLCISFIISHCSMTLPEVCQLSSPQCSHQSWVHVSD